MNSEAIAGLIGALIGALVGFGGVIWQFRAKSKSDKRKLGAELLFHSQQLHDGYLEEFGPEEDRVIRHSLQDLKRHQDQLVLLMRTWELIWDRRSFEAAGRHTSSAISYYQAASMNASMGSKPGSGVLFGFAEEWSYSRQLLIDMLSADFRIRWWQVRRRLRASRKVGDPLELAAQEYKKLVKQSS